MNKPDIRFEETKKFAEAFRTLTKIQRRVLSGLLIAGEGEDEIAEILGQEVVRDERGCPLATHSIDRVKNEAYRLLAQYGYNEEQVAHYLEEMGAYLF